MAEIEKNNEEDCTKINNDNVARRGPYLCRYSKKFNIGEKTLELYKHGYNKFMAWKSSKEYPSDLCTEKIFLEYFTELGKTHRPPSLWNRYAQLRYTVNEYHGVDIKKYIKLYLHLKKTIDGYTTSRTRTILSSQDVKRFLQDAPDSTYLAMKVALIFSMNGPCNRNEIAFIHAKDVEDHGEIILVKMKNARRRQYDKTPRPFIIRGKCYEIVKKYMDLRVKDGTCERFFQKYHNGRCMRQPIGAHKISNMPKEIARFLKLPNADNYSFRMTSADARKRISNGYVLSELDQDVDDENDNGETIDDKPDSDDEDDNENLLTLAQRSNTITGVKPLSSDVPEGKNDESNSGMDFSAIEISVPPVDGIKTERELSPSHEDPLSRSPTDSSENTAYRNNIIDSLDQCVKMTDKNLTYIFKHCNFTNCFNK